MRTKQEILKAYLDEGLDCKSDAHLSMLTVTSILEILIDMRDLQKQQLDYDKGGVEDIEPSEGEGH